MIIRIMFLGKQNGFDQGKKVLGWRILRDKMISIALAGRLSIFREVIACQHDDDDVRIILFDLFGKLKSAFSRQSDIHEDDPGMKDINGKEKLISIRFFCDIHRWKLGVQDLLEHLSKGRIILDDQCLTHGDPLSFLAGLCGMGKIPGERGGALSLVSSRSKSFITTLLTLHSMVNKVMTVFAWRKDSIF
jgi:hypothetical protein